MAKNRKEKDEEGKVKERKGKANAKGGGKKTEDDAAATTPGSPPTPPAHCGFK